MPEKEFEVLARQIFVDRVNKGQIPGDLDGLVAEQMISDYSERLEDVMNREILDELDRRGKVSEFNQLLEDDNTDPGEYLERTIPNCQDFMQQAIKTAMREVGNL